MSVYAIGLMVKNHEYFGGQAMAPLAHPVDMCIGHTVNIALLDFPCINSSLITIVLITLNVHGLS